MKILFYFFIFSQNLAANIFFELKLKLIGLSLVVHKFMEDFLQVTLFTEQMTKSMSELDCILWHSRVWSIHHSIAKNICRNV